MWSLLNPQCVVIARPNQPNQKTERITSPQNSTQRVENEGRHLQVIDDQRLSSLDRLTTNKSLGIRGSQDPGEPGARQPQLADDDRYARLLIGRVDHLVLREHPVHDVVVLLA